MRTGRVALLVGVAAVVAIGAIGRWWTTRPVTLTGFVIANGRLEAETLHVATKLPGRVVEVLVDEGDSVERNQVVARIDSDALRAELEAAEAELRATVELHQATAAAVQRAESQQALAVKEHARARGLRARNVIDEGSMDRRETELAVARASTEEALRQLARAESAIEAAAARAKRLRTDLEETELRAPRRGRVQYRLVEPGEVLGAGGRIATILDLDDVYMTVFLPTADVGRIAIGSEARIVLDSRPEDALAARITFVSSEAQFTPKQVETASERQKLSFRVKVQVLDGRDPRLHPGLPGVAYLRLDGAGEWPAKLR